jgi:hypothetical protein
MPTVIEGRGLNSWQEAVSVAFTEANIPPMPLEVINCFTFLTKTYVESELKAKADGYIAKELNVSFEWSNRKYEWWYVPVPAVKYIKRDFPHLSFVIDLYIAATAQFQYWKYDAMTCHKSEATSPCVLVGKFIDDIAMFDVPPVLLKAIADGDSSNFEVVEKDRFWTTWDVNGFEARMPDSFIPLLQNLKGKFSGKSLEHLKIISGGVGQLLDKNIAAATVLSLNSPSNTVATPPGTYQEIADCLMGQMGYQKEKAEKAAKYVVNLFPQSALQEQIKKAIYFLG